MTAPKTNINKAVVELRQAKAALEAFTNGTDGYAGDTPCAPDQGRYLDTWVWARLLTALDALDEAAR